MKSALYYLPLPMDPKTVTHLRVTLIGRGRRVLSSAKLKIMHESRSAFGDPVSRSGGIG